MFFGPVPEEIQQQYDRSRMAHEADAAQIHRLLTAADQDTAESLVKVLGAIADNTQAAYWLGLLIASNHARFGACLTCGCVHEADLPLEEAAGAGAPLEGAVATASEDDSLKCTCTSDRCFGADERAQFVCLACHARPEEPCPMAPA